MVKVFVTGAAGRVGKALAKYLSSYDLTHTDLIAEQNIGEVDVRNYEQLKRAMRGHDVVVHLAWNTKRENINGGFDPDNRIGTQNVYEAAVANKVSKVIFASSIHVNGLAEKRPPYSHIVSGKYKLVQKPLELITHDMKPEPDSIYAESKLYCEDIGRMYNEQCGISSVNLRLGSVFETDRPENFTHRDSAVWLSHRDWADLVGRAIKTDIDYDIFYGVSNNSWRFHDIERAKKMLGYNPQDDESQFKLQS